MTTPSHFFVSFAPTASCLYVCRKVSIVAMSGAVGEAQAFGSATGGASDLDNLGQIMNQTNPPMDGKAQQSQARRGQA